MLWYTGMCHANRLLFQRKSFDMGPIAVKKSLEFYENCKNSNISLL